MNAFPFSGWLRTVHHDGSERYVSDLYPRLGDTVRLRLRVAAGAPVRRVLVRIFPDGEQFFVPMEAQPLAEGSPSRWWEADLFINEPVVHYRFVLEANDGVWWYTAAGPTVRVPLDATDFRILADYDPPAWVHESVFYQIFPDRFANGDPGNDPRAEDLPRRIVGPHGKSYTINPAGTLPWGAPPPQETFSSFIFYGGDLQGIARHLDHVAELGANALYLNPIFTAHSNHKYDVTDYDHVDPHLGGDAALVALRKALDAQGMRYLLDIVPNHCGYAHPWFQAARADADAPEAEFFTFPGHPEEYASWLGVWTLPKLNYRSAELRRRIYAGDDAVFRRWLRPPFAADGWRVDVGNMLARQGPTQMGREVVQGIRQAVKATRPDAYLMGENFFDATHQLQGDQWDGAMNYLGFASPLRHWLGGYEQGAFGLKEKIVAQPPWPTAALEATWRGVRAAIPWAVALQQYNLLNSHDTDRIRTVVGGNDALHRLAVALLLTYPGVPGLYYGNEVGMANVPGLGARGCMPWDRSQWDAALFAYYRDLVALRRSSPVLRRGGFQMLAVEADTFAYQREGRAERIIVVAHRGKQPRPAGDLPVAHGDVPDGARFVERFSGREAVVREGALPLPEQQQGATLWEMAS